MNNPKQNILKVIRENLENPEMYEIFLFGSRARGDYKKNSDYDIGIRGPKKIDFFTLMEMKQKLSYLPFLIDIVDFKNVDKEFEKIASKNIELWK